ncbi:Uncharacterised protein [Halioglobus japonicus]|nr:Uncharacterised protein [Halioglobus japonicus]
MGWLLTLVYLWRRRAPKETENAASADTVSEKQAFKELMKACERGNPASTRAAMIAWAQTLSPGTTIVSLEQVSRMLADDEIRQQLEALDAALYRSEDAKWNGNILAACARRVRKHTDSKRKSTGEAEVQLYPSGH